MSLCRTYHDHRSLIFICRFRICPFQTRQTARGPPKWAAEEVVSKFAPPPSPKPFILLSPPFSPMWIRPTSASRIINVMPLEMGNLGRQRGEEERVGGRGRPGHQNIFMTGGEGEILNESRRRTWQKRKTDKSTVCKPSRPFHCVHEQRGEFDPCPCL